MSLKVIGTGLSRTGTTTLRRVLEELGFGPCYNSGELFTHPRGISFWESLEQGKPADYDSFFRNYNAIIGFPGYYFSQQLLKKNPDAKIILSTRDPEDWYDDISATVFFSGPSHVNDTYAEAAGEIDPVLADCINRIHGLQERILEDGYFEGRFAEKDYAVQRYIQWNEDIINNYPPERLLVYQVTEGWEPVCHFLGVLVPEEKPFPHLNHQNDFNRNSTEGFLQRLKESEGL